MELHLHYLSSDLLLLIDLSFDISRQICRMNVLCVLYVLLISSSFIKQLYQSLFSNIICAIPFTLYECVIMRSFVTCSFFLSFSLSFSLSYSYLFVHSHCTYRGLLLHLITQCHTHTLPKTLGRTPLYKGSDRRRDLSFFSSRRMNRLI